MIVRYEVRDLGTPTGTMRTHVYAPALPPGSRRLPGLLLYPEIYQQTGPIARLSMQFAGHGYVVMAPEIYHEHEPPGTVLAYDTAGTDKGNAYKEKTRLSTFDDDATVMLRALAADPACNGRIGAVGFCIGGHLAFRAALQPEILAACCFYPTDLQGGILGEGKCGDTLARAGEVRGELVMLWGRQDPHIPDGARAAIYTALRDAGVRFTWHEFNAEHAFMRDEGPRYDPEAARVGMGIALALFQRTL
ncbi:MAG TPA: dienelactone hydrolase family protein [Methylomirabilota bacterium]|nr:dienelactone hydrolase family protein [Methylomirabilota bacterium]